MPNNSSIALQVQNPEFDNPLQKMAQFEQLRGAQQQNKLMDMKFAESARANEYAGQRRNALTGAMNAETGELDAGKYRSRLAGIGDYEGLQSFGKDQSEQAKAQREADKSQLEQKLKVFEVSAQIMNGVKDQATWGAARQQVADLFGAEAAAKMPEQYDPQLIAQKVQQSMSMKEQLEQTWKKNGYDLDVDKFGETQRNNKAQTNQSNVNSLRSEASAAAGRAVTVGGQVMADTRARDFNSTKIEENNLKREAKDEAAALANGGKIASFDTMLGTLDRLGKHPGLSKSVGLMGAMPTMPGSDSANFQAELKTFQSQAFIPAVAQLKGMGALTDKEGEKLTAAVGALDTKMGEEAFRESVKLIITTMNSARARMVGGKAATPAAAASQPGGMMSVTNAADYAKVPSGATYTTPDGKTRKKP